MTDLHFWATAAAAGAIPAHVVLALLVSGAVQLARLVYYL